MPKPGTDLPADEEQSDNYPFTVARDRYVIIRKPSEQGSVVAKFEKGSNSPRLPEEIHDHPDFVVTYPGSKSALDGATVDQSNADLTDREKELLERAGYPVTV